MTVKHNVYKKLALLNSLPAADAEAAFLDCCGSTEWARRMTANRPFPMLGHMFQKAAEIWFSLSAADYLEAFAAHPKIGSGKPAAAQNKRAATWSRGEQAAARNGDRAVSGRLAEVNSLYENKFGFIFIVCATGRSAEEILAIAEARLGNSLQTEMQLAAEEQHKITELRLAKLLEE